MSKIFGGGIYGDDMIGGCSSLLSLPDTSKWNTYNVIDMSCMLSGCKSLLSLPDISKWNTSHLEKDNSMFEECNKLSNIPVIRKKSKGLFGGIFDN